MSLEDHYRPGAMTASVREAHEDLDHLVDVEFGVTDNRPTFLRRQEALFVAYEQLTAPLLTSPTKRRRRT
jgi:hypothetical protein